MRGLECTGFLIGDTEYMFVCICSILYTVYRDTQYICVTNLFICLFIWLYFLMHIWNVHFTEIVIQKNKFHHVSTYMVFDCNGMSTAVFCPDGIKVKDCTADERMRSLLTIVEPC